MNYNFKNLVFEGGGVKGLAYGGALEILHSKGILNTIERVAGTSAGAINASLLACGYTYKDVHAIIANTDFKSFQDKSPLFPTNIYRLVNSYGWYKGDTFRKWIADLIAKKTGNPNYTFLNLENDRGMKRYKELYVVASNLSMQKPVVFSYETTPNVAIADAVRASMSIPLYFQAIKKEAHYLVDGGVTWNYPINIFDYKKYLYHEENGISVEYSTNPEYVFNYETLGFRLDSKSVIEYAKNDWGNEPAQINNISDYIGALINFMMETANKSHLKKNDWNRTIFIDTLDVKTTEFRLSSERINALITSGKECASAYFNWRNSDPEWSKKPIINNPLLS